jgi:predicted anti-sigma-YlaC factor YlaD
MNMDCTESRDLISADLDGRPVDRDRLDAHLAGCADCVSWRDRAEALTRRTRPALVGVPSDTALPHGFLTYRWVRFSLAWAGILLIAWNIPGVFDGGLDESVQHLWRHQHAFGIALGATFLFVAWRPDRAYGLVPVAATFTIALGGAAAIDLINGSTPLTRETKHLVEIAGLIMLWVLGWSAGPGHRRTGPSDEGSV